jgi:hypothetical protein
MRGAIIITILLNNIKKGEDGVFKGYLFFFSRKVSGGLSEPTENCFLTTYHSSFMVHWWVLVHYGHGPQGLP